MKNKNLSYYKLEQDNKKLKQKIERLEDELASIPEVIVGDVEPNANILMIDSEDNVPETAFSFL
jgi:cell division septum initiation protein DivIVA